MTTQIYISTEIDISGIIENLPEADRIEWVRAIVSTIAKAGTIEAIRKVVNDSGYDD